MNRLIDFSSRFRILKGGKISLVVSALLGSVTLSFAAPSGGTVTSGTATINQSGNVTNINQSSQKASINWQNFSIARNETVNFNQPNVNSITLNRVIGNEKSVIDGALNANGQVWILNSNGVLFGKNASINTSGILATTAQLSDADFNAGNYNFKNSTSASIINQGAITVVNTGSVVLASNEVRNSGTIKAVKGKVYLIGADSYSLNLNGNSLVNLKVNKGVLDALVKNSGTILADGGEIYLTTNAVNELLKGVVNNTGIIEANSLDGITGKVELFAHGGTAEISGTIEAKDGFVETSGKEFSIDKNAKVKAKTWLIDPTNLTVDDATAYETSLNGGADVIIQTNNATGSDEGNIYINDTIDWSTAQKLTLNAYKNIYINSAITASNAGGKVALYYGQGAVATGNTAKYHVNAPINLKAGDNFFTKLGSNGVITTWKVITALGSAGSTTGTDLQGMNGNLSGNYVLGANINANATVNWNYNGTLILNEGFNPIGAPGNGNQFSGNFDGLGHTISNLTINKPINFGIGLFGSVNGATISNVGLTNVNIKGSSQVGGLVGSSWGDGVIIKNSYTTGTIVGMTYEANDHGNIYYTNGEHIGGLVGLFYGGGTIENSYSSADVSGKVNAGGLVGYNSGTIKNSYATGSVTGINTITNDTTDVNIDKDGMIEFGTGGLVGANGGTIQNSYAVGVVTGSSNRGGLVGYKYEDGTVTNSYYDKTINSSGMSDTTYGKTTKEMQTASTFAGWDDTIWAMHKAPEDIEGFDAGAVAGYLYLINVTRNEDITGHAPTGEFLFSGGSGTEVNPYTITNWTQLQNINHSNILTQNYYFSLLNNLGSSTSDYTDLASSTANGGLGWNPIGNSITQFTGNFDGLGHTVDNLSINRPSESIIGLFGATNGATISNIGLTNVDIIGQSNIGALIGTTRVTVNDAATIIQNSFSTGTIVGKSYEEVDLMMGDTSYYGGENTGGLVGMLGNSSILRNSYSTANVSSRDNTGGLVGRIYQSTIENSYATGSVTGINTVTNDTTSVGNMGGLVGYNGGTIQNSYAIGRVTGLDGSLGGLVAFTYQGTASNSFYDSTVNSSGMNDTDYGKTTKEMQTLSTFDDAGWDIELDETMKKIYPYLTFDETGGAIWKVGKYATALNYILGTQNTTYNGTNQALTDFWANTIFGDIGSSLVAGTDYKFVYDSEDATAFKNAGTYSDISVVILNEDYELDETGTNTLGKFVIAKKDATITANSNSVTYNGSTQNVNGFTATGLVGDETESVLTGISGATASGKNAGEYTTTLTGTDGNYNLTFVDGSLTITPKQITVSADDLEKILGSNDPLLTYIAKGIIGEDVLEGLLSRDSGETVGEYKISKGTLANSNYAITFNDGMLTIKRDKLEDIITPVVNNIVVPQTPKIEINRTVVASQAQPVVMASTGQTVNLLSQPTLNQNTTMVTIGELRAEQNLDTPNASSDIRVPVGDNSIIELVNGGVNLPNGLEQQFFVVANEIN